MKIFFRSTVLIVCTLALVYGCLSREPVISPASLPAITTESAPGESQLNRPHASSTPLPRHFAQRGEPPFGFAVACLEKFPTEGDPPSGLVSPPTRLASELPPAAALSNLKLALPIDCALGQDCFILQYPDRDPGPQSIDFSCGRLTYDGHDGTDFAIPDERAMAAGVAVKAAASGKVRAVRDGVADRRIEAGTQTAVAGTECGNGVLLDHNSGWQTQYCHLRQGSVAVKPGTRVQAGTVLGLVGESGLASFPHVHLTVRYQGTTLDPFIGSTTKSGCHVARHPLWAKPLAYVPTGLVRAGFANQSPSMADVWQGRFWETVLPLNSAAVIFWVQTYGVLQGDVEYFRVVAPSGKVVVEQQRQIEAPNRVWLSYRGKKATESQPLLPGVWQGEYRLVRQGQVLMNLNRKMQLR